MFTVTSVTLDNVHKLGKAVPFGERKWFEGCGKEWNASINLHRPLTTGRKDHKVAIPPPLDDVMPL